MKPREAVHTLPSPSAATTLAATPKDRKPVSNDLVDETTDADAVAGDGVIIQPALYHSPQPSTCFAYWPVHSPSQISLDLLEFGTHAFRHRTTMDHEPAMFACLGTYMCEAKKIKRLRPAFTASLSTFGRKAPKLQQTRLPFVKLQSELGESRAEFLQARPRLAVMLETDHEVIRITYHHHIAAAAVLPPPLDPLVKHIVQEYVRE